MPGPRPANCHGRHGARWLATTGSAPAPFPQEFSWQGRTVLATKTAPYHEYTEFCRSEALELAAVQGRRWVGIRTPEIVPSSACAARRSMPSPSRRIAGRSASTQTYVTIAASTRPPDRRPRPMPGNCAPSLETERGHTHYPHLAAENVDRYAGRRTHPSEIAKPAHGDAGTQPPRGSVARCSESLRLPEKTWHSHPAITPGGPQRDSGLFGCGALMTQMACTEYQRHTVLANRPATA